MPPVPYHNGRFPPDERLDWIRLVPLIGPAEAALARYDGLLSAVPNPALLLSPLTAQEAVMSSRIEGTQASLSEVLEFEAGRKPSSPSVLDDIHEINNYRKGMLIAEKLLEKVPLCQRVILETHKILLSGVRGQDKSPGEFRKHQNWIGIPGSSIETATFVPIAPEKLSKALTAWENYLHSDSLNRLVQLAIVHAEFEALHPFRDGNGRLGRMLIPLFLWKYKLIQQPMFYISSFLEAHRDAYYEGLLSVSKDDNWTGWCCYFLEAIRSQAEENSKKVQGILSLYEKIKSQISEITNSRYAIQVLDWIFSKLIFSTTDFIKGTGISKPTALRILKRLGDSEVLKTLQERSGPQPAVLVFPDLWNVTEGKTVFETP